MSASRTLEERVERLERVIKKHRQEITDINGAIVDLWDTINANEEARAQFEDETRDISERARRATQRLDKKFRELIDEAD